MLRKSIRHHFARPTASRVSASEVRHLDSLEPRQMLSGGAVTLGVLPNGDINDPAYQDFLQTAGVIDVTNLPDALKETYNVEDANPAASSADAPHDDTAAIQAAISWALGWDPTGPELEDRPGRFRNNYNRNTAPPFIFLPDGVYDVSDTIEVKNLLGESFSSGWRRGLQLVGQTQTGTVIRLADNAAGYTADAAETKAVIKTGSPKAGTAVNVNGAGNQAFDHSIYNLTIDVGVGNANAIGVDYQVSNRGAIEDVIVRSSDPAGLGAVGISMTRGVNGPGAVLDTQIIGFDIGIETAAGDYGLTYENIVMRGQNEAGFKNRSQPIHIRGLDFEGDVPGYVNTDGFPSITLLDSTFTYTGDALTPPAAIETVGKAFIRDTVVTGFDVAVDHVGEEATYTIAADVPVGPSGRTVIDEYKSHETLSLFESSQTSLRLEVQETPEYHTDDLDLWISVTDYGATPSLPSQSELFRNPATGRYDIPNDFDDDGAAINAAIAAINADPNIPDGVILYFPVGDYIIDEAIVVEGKIRKIFGMNAAVQMRDDRVSPVFEVNESNGGIVYFEHFQSRGNSVLHNSNDTLVFRHTGGLDYESTENGRGDVFIEDTRGISPTFKEGQRVWARQFNSEFLSPQVVNDGADLWVFGFKTEGKRNTAFASINGARTEVLGAYLYSAAFDPNDPASPPADQPAFYTEDSEVSISATLGSLDKVFNGVLERGRYEVAFREVRDGETRDMLQTRFDENEATTGWFRGMPLYRSGGTPDETPSYVVDNNNDYNEAGAAFELTGDWAFLKDNVFNDRGYGKWVLVPNNQGELVYRYEDDWRLSRTNSTVDSTATWSQELPAGRYRVETRHVARGDTATDAPFTINHAGGQTAVAVDQTTSDKQWVDLGLYNFDNVASVSVTNVGANGRVTADAVRFVYVGPVEAAWNFDGVLTAGVVPDVSNNGHAGRLQQQASVNDAGSLALTGGQDHVDLGNLNVEDATAFSISAWVNPTEYLNNKTGGRIISKADSTSNHDHDWMLAVNKDGGLRFRLGMEFEDGSERTRHAKGPDGSVPLNEWTHVAATWDGDRIRLYINGEEVFSRRARGVKVSSDASVPVAIGNQPGTLNRPFTGQIDDVEVRVDALTADEIASMASIAPGSVAAAPTTSAASVATAPSDDSELLTIAAMMSSDASPELLPSPDNVSDDFVSSLAVTNDEFSVIDSLFEEPSDLLATL